MTDEEMAEGYADTVKCEWENETYWVDCRDEITDAYLAGLDAGRPKWHKVADGDLPPEYTEVLNDDGVKVILIHGHWRYFYGDEWEDDACVHHWCEIPQYTEEA